MTASRAFTDLLSNSPKRSPRFSPGYEGTENMFYFLSEKAYTLLHLLRCQCLYQPFCICKYILETILSSIFAIKQEKIDNLSVAYLLLSLSNESLKREFIWIAELASFQEAG